MTKKSQTNNPATKSDFKNLVTKTDLTKALKKYATKTDLKNVEKSVRREILRVEEKVENLEEKFDKKFDNVMTKLDGIAGGIDALREENTVGAHHTRKLRVQVDDHESRITTLESH